jgi:hypothetical protein
MGSSGAAPAADVAAGLYSLAVAGCALQQLYGYRASNLVGSSSRAMHMPLHVGVAYRLLLLAQQQQQ